jgi:hypothetical protein
MGVKTSKKFSLNLRDFKNGSLVAMITPVAYLVQQSIDQGNLHFNWKQLGMAALSGLIGYLFKNFLTPAQTIITHDDKPIKE